MGRVISLLFAGVIASWFNQQVEIERKLRRVEGDINSRLMVLNELMSLELGSELDLGKTIDGIARLTRKAIDAEYSAVCLFSRRGSSGVNLRIRWDTRSRAGLPDPRGAAGSHGTDSQEDRTASPDRGYIAKRVRSSSPPASTAPALCFAFRSSSKIG